MARRLLRLCLGLPLYGIGCALCVRAGLGVDPWTVLAEGVAVHTGIGIGWVTNILGALVLVLWIPLRQRPGIGTLANVLLVGTSMQGALALVPPAGDLLAGIALLGGGILTVALASAVYLGAGLGAGPRDGLMAGLRTRFGWPLWTARTAVEGTVLLLGWMLGGTVGVGTIAFAASIGPCVHLAVRLLPPTGSATNAAQDEVAVTRRSSRYPSHS